MVCFILPPVLFISVHSLYHTLFLRTPAPDEARPTGGQRKEQQLNSKKTNQIPLQCNSRHMRSTEIQCKVSKKWLLSELNLCDLPICMWCAKQRVRYRVCWMSLELQYHLCVHSLICFSIRLPFRFMRSKAVEPQCLQELAQALFSRDLLYILYSILPVVRPVVTPAHTSKP